MSSKGLFVPLREQFGGGFCDAHCAGSAIVPPFAWSRAISSCERIGTSACATGVGGGFDAQPIANVIVNIAIFDVSPNPIRIVWLVFGGFVNASQALACSARIADSLAS